jgi:hypothetical protein
LFISFLEYFDLIHRFSWLFPLVDDHVHVYCDKNIDWYVGHCVVCPSVYGCE